MNYTTPNSYEVKFNCKPINSTGSKSGQIKDKTGTTGTVLKSFTVTVSN